MGALGHWLYQNVVGNLVASAIAFTVGYVWKIRPHHRDVERWLGGVHERMDAAGIPDVGEEPGRHSSDGVTGVMQAVPDGR